MIQSSGFIFVPNTRDYVSSDAVVARVSGDILSTRQLLDLFYRSLYLPGYFGFNWNALFDCLCDLHWLDERNVAIVHDELPRLSPSEMGTYLSVLSDSTAEWQPWEAHSVQAVFNDRDHVRVEAILKGVQFP